MAVVVTIPPIQPHVVPGRITVEQQVQERSVVPPDETKAGQEAEDPAVLLAQLGRVACCSTACVLPMWTSNKPQIATLNWAPLRTKSISLLFKTIVANLRRFSPRVFGSPEKNPNDCGCLCDKTRHSSPNHVLGNVKSLTVIHSMVPTGQLCNDRRMHPEFAAVGLFEGVTAPWRWANLVPTFDDGGAVFRLVGEPHFHLRLSLTQVRRSSGNADVVQHSQPLGENLVTWARTTLSTNIEESWEETDSGIEHRVILSTKPSGQGIVELSFAVDGMIPEKVGNYVILTDSRARQLMLKDYFVRDSLGKMLEGSMTVQGGEIVYRFDDTSAKYPVEVDPLLVTERAKIQETNKVAGNQFGGNVAVSSDGNTALISALSPNTEGDADWGVVYVFSRTAVGWAQEALLEPEVAIPYSSFGSASALSADGNVALIGAGSSTHDGATNNGIVYVFTRTASGWEKQAQLVASDTSDDLFFGTAVAISADGATALIGAFGATTNGLTSAGAAFLFTSDGASWSEKNRLVANDPATFDAFGRTVALAGDGQTALVAAPSIPTIDQLDRPAYIFYNNGTDWEQQAKISHSDLGLVDGFGLSLALSYTGDVALVGAPTGGAGDGVESGVVYVYNRVDSGWINEAILQPVEVNLGERFGSSLALSGEAVTAVIGAPDTNYGSLNQTGAVYLFHRNGGLWSQESMRFASDAHGTQLMGAAVAGTIENALFLVGAPGDSDSQLDAFGVGAVYAFSVEDTNDNGGQSGAALGGAQGVGGGPLAGAAGTAGTASFAGASGTVGAPAAWGGAGSGGAPTEATSDDSGCGCFVHPTPALLMSQVLAVLFAVLLLGGRRIRRPL